MSKKKKYAMLSLVIALFGEIYFYPFESKLKFSAGVIAFNLIILIVDDVSELRLSFLCGVIVFTIRDTISILFSSNSIIEMTAFNLPSLAYYIFYGIFLKITKIKKHKDNMFYSILLLALGDSLSNIFEAIIRNHINLHIVRVIIIVGFIRSFIAYFIYLSYNKQKLFILNREHQKRYTQLNFLISNIQAEVFYLKKSMKDIEKVMSKSYSLYETYKDNEHLREKTLDIAREVHEIKKDYHRVLGGFQALVNDLENEDVMTLSNIFTIVNDNTSRYIKEKNMDVKISFSFEKDFKITSYYNLFVMINNLIINSIEECENKGYIKITEKEYGDEIYIEVTDTGKGIEEEVLPYIFNPGFTTKYDEVTGKASTGIGLSHVKNIIEDLGGNVDVKSETNIGTTFTLKIPKNSLIGE